MATALAMRRLVMERLGSATYLSTAPEALAYIERYEAKPDRFGPDSLTVAQAVKVDNEKALAWLSKGAQPTDTVRKLLEISGAWESFTGKAPATPAPSPANSSPAEASGR